MGGICLILTQGAHIDVHIADDLIRQYSLCNAPTQKDIYRIGVLNDAHFSGRVKNKFLKNLGWGKKLQFLNHITYFLWIQPPPIVF